MERRQLQARQAELDETVACLIVDQREKVGDDDNSTSADSFSDDHLFANISSRLLREYEIEVQLQARAVETKQSVQRGKSDRVYLTMINLDAIIIR
jgi:hypothetical protein